MTKNVQDVILEPVITEKSTALSQFNKYTFQVGVNASKPAIKHAFEQAFPERKVKSIQTLKIMGHKRRTKLGFKLPRDFKKAILTVEGPKIDFFPEVS